MSAVEVQLVGGPANGHLTVIEGDPMDPPATVEVAVLPELNWTALAQQSDEVVLFRKALYRRAVSPLDDGPLWQYLYDAEASH